jgi:predicted GTPase
MNWILITEILIVIGIVLAFGGAVWYLVTHNPNYEPKELLKQPWKLFDLIDHAKQNVAEGLKKIKEQTQEAIDTTKAIKDEVKEVVKQVQDTIKETKDDIKELGDKK